MEFLFFIHPEGEVLLLCKSLKIRIHPCPSAVSISVNFRVFGGSRWV